jgi:hypothetical protein
MGKLSLAASLAASSLAATLAANIENVSGNTSGTTSLNIYNFIDNFGNINQIEKKSKDRLKYYIDPEFIQGDEPCVIGISDPISGDCSYGIGLGLGDNTWAYAKYD